MIDPVRSAIRERYLGFAHDQAHGSSPTFEAWANAVAVDSALLDLLVPLPPAKQQPNLVFAAARVHGAVPGDVESLRATLLANWPEVQATILDRSTQTNEAARCAALLLGLDRIDGPIALLEVGASAGLCLVPDRYSYVFGETARLDPHDGPSNVTITVPLEAGLQPPARMPDIVWRAGLDLNPLDAADPDDVAWLQALIWPEHEHRSRRLDLAAPVTAAQRVIVHPGDLLTDLPRLAQQAPDDATLVVMHSATLAYLDEAARGRAVDVIASTGARRISFEGRGVDPAVPPIARERSPQTLFVAALDGQPYALSDGHARALHRVR